MKRSDSLDRTIFSVTNVCPSCGERIDSSEIICPQDGTLLVNGLQAGTIVDGRYEYVSTIGFGGMGLVVQAKDLQSENVVVALKMLLRKSSSADVSRFEQEARAASLLDHPNIIAMRDYGVTENGCPFLVMDYIEGSNLASIISSKGALELNESVDLFKQLCETMSYAHGKGVLHRDLKPSNIMLIQSTDGLRIKVVDFGIAKIIPESGITEKNLTQTGQILGSPLYMSPEQALGKPVDKRTDIYSATCVLYHMLTGAPPIEGSSSIETLFQHVNVVPLPLTEASVGRKFTSELENVVAKALSKDPQSRQDSFDQLNSEIQQALSVPAKNANGKLARAGSEGSQKHRALLSLFLLSCVVAAISIYLMKNRDSATIDGQGVRGHSITEPSGTSLKIHDPHEENAGALDIDLTADGLARAIVDQAFNEKTEFVDLKINDKSVTNNTIEFLVTKLRKSPRRLRSLDLTQTAIDDDGIKQLVELKPVHLKSLSIAHTRVGAKGLSALSNLKSLEQLDIHELKGLNHDSLNCLAQLTRLKDLNINKCFPATSKEISTRFLRRLKSLQSLSAASNSQAIGDDIADNISNLAELRSLDLSWSNFGNTGLLKLKNIGGLEKLNLSGATLSDSAIDALANAAQLKVLTLNKQPISDVALEQLGRLYERNRIDLIQLNLVGCRRLSEKGILQLQKNMPHCVVNWSN